VLDLAGRQADGGRLSIGHDRTELIIDRVVIGAAGDKGVIGAFSGEWKIKQEIKKRLLLINTLIFS
jgi:hypothetical protein